MKELNIVKKRGQKVSIKVVIYISLYLIVLFLLLKLITWSNLTDSNEIYNSEQIKEYTLTKSFTP